MQIEQYRNTQKLHLNSGNTKPKAQESAPDEVKKKDLIKISPKSAEFTKAVDTVRREMHAIKQTGYFDPPPYLSNNKQREIIGDRIAGLLSSPSDKEQLETAAMSLWKEIGLRDENEPSPDPFRNFGQIYDFLTKEDRKDMDLLYDEIIAQGNKDNKSIKKELSSVAFPLAVQRDKEASIRAGVIWYSSDHILPSITYGPDATGVRPPEYSRDIDPRFNKSGKSELQNSHTVQAQELLHSLIDNMTGTQSEKIEKISIFENLRSFLSKEIFEMPEAPKSKDLFEVLDTV